MAIASHLLKKGTACMKHLASCSTHVMIRASMLALLALGSYARAYDNAHFYRATNFFFFEPRFAKQNLSSFDAMIGYGSTHHSRPKSSSCDDCNDTCLLDICGFSNMQQLAVGVPDKDLSNPLDLLITQLALTPARDLFGQYSIGGKFSITEVTLSWMYNFTDNFFVHLILPVRRMSINCIHLRDLSPTSDPAPNINTPIWQAFQTSFPAILARYDLSIAPFKKTGIGDLSAFVGWTYNFQDTELLDFIDTTIRIGLIAPTGKKQNVDEAFSLPLGYNGHVGGDFSADIAVGAFEWLTFGAHIEAIVFSHKTQTVRMKTGLFQSGMIYLAKGKAKVDLGNQLVASVYAKADHVIRGFSATLGYTYARQSSTKISPCDCETFCPTIVNSNDCLLGWKMHTLNFFFEYDFTKEDDRIGPRVGVYYNRQFSGTNVFKTNMAGGTIGVECMWEF